MSPSSPEKSRGTQKGSVRGRIISPETVWEIRKRWVEESSPTKRGYEKRTGTTALLLVLEKEGVKGMGQAVYGGRRARRLQEGGEQKRKTPLDCVVSSGKEKSQKKNEDHRPVVLAEKSKARIPGYVRKNPAAVVERSLLTHLKVGVKGKKA